VAVKTKPDPYIPTRDGRTGHWCHWMQEGGYAHPWIWIMREGWNGAVRLRPEHVSHAANINGLYWRPAVPPPGATE
jgi:hypothetical protein